LAAVILFALNPLLKDIGFIPYGFAIFGGGDDKEQFLIAEEALRAQFQQVEERLLREGSYVYPYYQNFGVGVGYLADFDEGFGGEEVSNSVLVQGIAFLSPSNPSLNLLNSKGIFNKRRSGIITYKVQTGDTPSRHPFLYCCFFWHFNQHFALDKQSELLERDQAGSGIGNFACFRSCS